jgi:uptake hydrogenase large subunit
MSRRIVGPFNRVEGDLEVQLEFSGEQVSDAWVVSPLYRGFEHILHGKDPRDALVISPRICGICSVSQSVAAASALADIQRLQAPTNGALATNLILATENLADHLTHFYLFFMPDFCREVYKSEPWFDWVSARFKALKGEAARDVLGARAEFMHILGLLAGKWPHTLAIQPGGTTRSLEPQEKMRVVAVLAGFRGFLETTLFGDSLESIVALDSEAALSNWAGARDAKDSDFRTFLHLADTLELGSLGRAADRFLSYGAYRMNGSTLFASGTYVGDQSRGFLTTDITEDASHAWLSDSAGVRHPFDGVTIPDADAADGYTWCKAPRLRGEVVEVGALARQAVDGHPLIRDLVTRSGGNVRNRVIARLLEIARIQIAMEEWARAISPRSPFCVHRPTPEEAEGFGLVEAARGSLGHWLKVSNGRISNYQIISPTTWNFSPRDHNGQRGALEQALVGAPVRAGEKDPVSVQHIVRSFDPCMVCTVH